MCLETNQLIPYLALRDIKVYKTLTQKNTSPFMCMQYSAMCGFSAKMKRESGMDKWFQIQDGLHAYTSLEQAKRLSGWFGKVVEATIPKGAWYYKGTRDEIVSNRLVMGDLKAL